MATIQPFKWFSEDILSPRCRWASKFHLPDPKKKNVTLCGRQFPEHAVKLVEKCEGDFPPSILLKFASSHHLLDNDVCKVCQLTLVTLERRKIPYG